MLNENQMKALAAQTFKDYPDAESVIVFPDGNCFLGTSASFAKMHARDSKLEGLTIQKSEVELKPKAETPKTEAKTGVASKGKSAPATKTTTKKVGEKAKDAEAPKTETSTTETPAQ